MVTHIEMISLENLVTISKLTNEQAWAFVALNENDRKVANIEKIPQLTDEQAITFSCLPSSLRELSNLELNYFGVPKFQALYEQEYKNAYEDYDISGYGLNKSSKDLSCRKTDIMANARSIDLLVIEKMLAHDLDKQYLVIDSDSKVIRHEMLDVKRDDITVIYESKQGNSASCGDNSLITALKAKKAGYKNYILISKQHQHAVCVIALDKGCDSNLAYQEILRQDFTEKDSLIDFKSYKEIFISSNDQSILDNNIELISDTGPPYSSGLDLQSSTQNLEFIYHASIDDIYNEKVVAQIEHAVSTHEILPSLQVALENHQVEIIPSMDINTSDNNPRSIDNTKEMYGTSSEEKLFAQRQHFEDTGELFDTLRNSSHVMTYSVNSSDTYALNLVDHNADDIIAVGSIMSFIQ